MASLQIEHLNLGVGDLAGGRRIVPHILDEVASVVLQNADVPRGEIFILFTFACEEFGRVCRVLLPFKGTQGALRELLVVWAWPRSNIARL